MTTPQVKQRKVKLCPRCLSHNIESALRPSWDELCCLSCGYSEAIEIPKSQEEIDEENRNIFIYPKPFKRHKGVSAKTSRRLYRQSPAGKAAVRRYNHSELNKENQRRYRESEKGQESQARYWTKIRMFKCLNRTITHNETNQGMNCSMNCKWQFKSKCCIHYEVINKPNNSYGTQTCCGYEEE
jgi:hypothetical protein